MSTSTSVAVVLVEDPMKTEAIAVAGFLAGYCGSTRRSYATDLRLFAAWCHEANLSLFSVRRSHIELFGRWLEETGRMRSTVARRLSTLASGGNHVTIPLAPRTSRPSTSTSATGRRGRSSSAPREDDGPLRR